MRVERKGSSRSRELPFTSLLPPVLECYCVCWYPYRFEQIKSLETVQDVAAKFVTRGNPGGNEANWGPSKSLRELARLYAILEALRGDPCCEEVTCPELHGDKYVPKGKEQMGANSLISK